MPRAAGSFQWFLHNRNVRGCYKHEDHIAISQAHYEQLQMKIILYPCICNIVCGMIPNVETTTAGVVMTTMTDANMTTTVGEVMTTSHGATVSTATTLALFLAAVLATVVY